MINWGQLISLANRAKEMGCNVIANIVTAVAIYEVTNDSSSLLALEWETTDAVGGSLREPYYDLLVVVDGVGAGSQRLCIPAPLLSSGAVVACLKRAKLVPRRFHERAYRDPWAPWPDLEPLWVEIDQILDRGVARRAVESCLDGDTAVKILKLIDQSWHTLAEGRRAMLFSVFPFLDEAIAEGVVKIRDDGSVHVSLSRAGKDAWADVSPEGEIDADCLVGTSNLHLSELEHWISALVGSEKAAEAVRNLRS